MAESYQTTHKGWSYKYSMMKHCIGLIIVMSLASLAIAQYAPGSYGLSGARGLDDVTPEPRLGSNVIIDILPFSQDTLWLGTGNGVTRIVYNPERPGGFGFETMGEAQGLGKGGVSGLYVSDTIMWSAFAFDTAVGISGAGGGLAYSRDHGRNWTWLPQPRDQVYQLNDDGKDLVLGYWPTATNVDNITYELALSDSSVWIVSKGGGLRKHYYAADYTDYNDTTGWRVVSPDTFDFHPGERLNHRAFSIVYAEDALWVGTADGINKSTDEGYTWQSFRSVNSGISGNFVTAMAYQQATNAVWAATWRAEGQTEFYAVSKTTDGGATWTVHLTEAQILEAIGVAATPRVHSFAFDGTIVYACDDLGLWKSTDGGNTWGLFPPMADAQSGHRFDEVAIYAAQKEHGRLWAGGIDGLALSYNDGVAWTIFQAATPLDDSERSVDTYAYPTPWSPSRFGPVKLRYRSSGGNIKVTIYDFAMSEVAELATTVRGPGEEYETWDGRKDGAIVANGTYFYKIEKPDGEVWGKLIVLD